ncbi:hypothetical protein HOP50_19g83440 [Chloropicon primus]|uniref:BZIP domain-containing protein n=1 Tax=Chloropicon primus TaxID=1764295 RepID=A0A5B8N147_9CHLO|nr:hypothetical protein A3770_19p83200 [Chloropicon primus]UPR04997.1 hypothetical protein HOP50_19g83440 [Chloropicon primus]|eukprot:QDZ25802.1 hypothetical protein A3770_19p83200 [Chloropicon primus]
MEPFGIPLSSELEKCDAREGTPSPPPTGVEATEEGSDGFSSPYLQGGLVLGETMVEASKQMFWANIQAQISNLQDYANWWDEASEWIVRNNDPGFGEGFSLFQDEDNTFSRAYKSLKPSDQPSSDQKGNLSLAAAPSAPVVRAETMAGTFPDGAGGQLKGNCSVQPKKGVARAKGEAGDEANPPPRRSKNSSSALGSAKAKKASTNARKTAARTLGAKKPSATTRKKALGILQSNQEVQPVPSASIGCSKGFFKHAGAPAGANSLWESDREQQKVIQRKHQNRMASAKFRKRNRESRVKVAELEKENARLKEENEKLRSSFGSYKPPATFSKANNDK